MEFFRSILCESSLATTFMGAAVWPTVKILSNYVGKQFPLALPLLSLSWGLSLYAASAASIGSSFSFAPFAQPCHFGIRIAIPPV